MTSRSTSMAPRLTSHSGLGVSTRSESSLTTSPGGATTPCGFRRCPDNQWAGPLAQLAVDDECRVVLTGQGGDHALYGDLRAVADDLVERGELSAAWRLLGNDTTRVRVKVRALVRGVVLKQVARRELGPVARLVARGASARQHQQAESTRALLGPVLRDLVVTRERRSPGDQRFDQPRSLRRSHYTGSMSYFVELWDETATDGGIEFRHPFLDVRVIELVSRLGEDIIGWGGQARGLHRRAFGDLLPRRTLDRSDKALFNRPWIDAALKPAHLVCDAGNDSLSLLLDLPALREQTEALATEPMPSLNLWHWWGAVAIGLWALNCDPW